MSPKSSTSTTGPLLRLTAPKKPSASGTMPNEVIAERNAPGDRMTRAPGSGPEKVDKQPRRSGRLSKDDFAPGVENYGMDYAVKRSLKGDMAAQKLALHVPNASDRSNARWRLPPPAQYVTGKVYHYVNLLEFPGALTRRLAGRVPSPSGKTFTDIYYSVQGLKSFSFVPQPHDIQSSPLEFHIADGLNMPMEKGADFLFPEAFLLGNISDVMTQDIRKAMREIYNWNQASQKAYETVSSAAVKKSLQPSQPGDIQKARGATLLSPSQPGSSPVRNLVRSAIEPKAKRQKLAASQRKTPIQESLEATLRQSVSTQQATLREFELQISSIKDEVSQKEEQLQKLQYRRTLIQDSIETGQNALKKAYEKGLEG